MIKWREDCYDVDGLEMPIISALRLVKSATNVARLVIMAENV